MPCTFIVHVLKQLVAWQVAASLDDSRQAHIVQIDRMSDAALAAELEPYVGSLHHGVPIAHGRQTDGSVVARVLLVADSDERLLEQLNGGRQYLLAR